MVPVLDGERDDLFHPYVKRRARRAMINFLANSYFHLALEEFDGDVVLVGCDLHDTSKVWVRQIEIERQTGREVMGRLICVAIFAGKRYIPTRSKRLQDKLVVVEAELSPGRFLEIAPTAPMPIIDMEPQPVLAAFCDLNALRDQLQHAETALVCADMIDSNARRDGEMAHWRARVATLKHELAMAGGRAS